MMPLGLLKKELRQILPWAVAILLLETAMQGFEIVLGFPDFRVWAEGAPIFGASGRGVMLAVWAFVLAYAGFPREHDDGTLPFLFALPIPRSALFLAKASAAAGILILAILLSELLRWLGQLPNPGSFGGHTFRLDWALLGVGLSGAVALIALAYALFFSVFRWFGLLLALVLWTVLAVLEQHNSGLKWLNPLELLAVEFDGTRALVPWTDLLGHAACAAALGAIAAGAWVGPVDSWASRVSRWSARLPAKILLVIGFGGLIVGGVAYYAFETDDGSLWGSDIGFELLDPGPEAQRTSRRYRFRYRSVHQTRIDRLASRADGVHDEIVRRLGGGVGAVIEVNLLMSSPSHAGSATWNSIRMDYYQAYDDETLERTLAHETAHVIALRVSDRRIVDHSESTKLFDEGLAEYLAFGVVPSSVEREAHWLEAVLARKRLRLDTSDLFDAGQFRAQFGELLFYPVGFSWLEALIATCGTDAPARVLRGFRRPEAPKGLAGWVLWQNTLEAVNCDLNQVMSRWVELLDKKADELQAEIDRVPRLAGGIARLDGDAIIVRAEIEGSPDASGTFQLHTRSSASDQQGQYLTFNADLGRDGGVEFIVDREQIAGKALEFQFVHTWVRKGALVQHAERWQRGRIP